MRTPPVYRTNRDLFSNRYLDERLPETASWNEVGDDELRDAYAEVVSRWERVKDTASERDVSWLEGTFVRPTFRTLGIPFEADENTDESFGRPDYGFFDSEEAARSAVDRREDDGDCYENAVAVAHIGEWGRSPNTRDSGEHEGDFANPGYWAHISLQETPARWAVLTDGRKWRLYHAATSRRLDSYYEIDLPAVLEEGDLNDFEYFYRFFRHEAFLEDAAGDCSLDEIYAESNDFTTELATNLQDAVYEALAVLAEGFLRHPDNDLDEGDLGLIRDGSLVYLYRLVFVLYAESEDRERLDIENERYEQSYRVDALKREVAEGLDGANPQYRHRQDDLWSRLDDLFALVDQGSESRGYPEDDLDVPAYGGDLFRTEPDADSAIDRELRFLTNNIVGDTSLARVIELLTRSENGDGEKRFVDYSSLDVRHLGSIYEELLAYELDVADEPLALDDGTYVSADEGDDVVVDAGDVYLTTDSGERKASGSFYTPEHVVEYVVKNTLGPLVTDVENDLLARTARDEPEFADEFAREIFDLNVLDPAMGTGHFLTSAVDYLAREIVGAQAEQAARQGVETVDSRRNVEWARRQVAERCIYGVDLNPLAVELANASLWLRTLGDGERPASLNHRLKTGDSLVGSDTEEIEGLNIKNGEFTDATEMEAKDDEVELDELRRRLAAIANVHTAREFGVNDVPDATFERMAAALEDDAAWERLSRARWFEDAQSSADADRYFHWELEFPEVFDDENPDLRDEPGFDAVVGNPPWVATAGRTDVSATIETALRSYLEDAFEATEDQFDLYVAFYEQFVRRSNDGRVGIVVPDAILTREQTEPIRALVLEQTSLSRIVRVGTAFDGVETGAAVIVSGDEGSDVRCADATESGDLSALAYDEIPQRVFAEQDARRFLVHLDETTRSILAAVEERPPLASFVEISRGEEIGKRAEFLREVPQDGTRPIAPGGAVVPYGIDGDELRHVDPADVEKAETNYRSPKLVFRQTSESLVGTYDDEGLATIKSAYNLHSKSDRPDVLKHVLGVLDSPLLNFYHHYKHTAYRSVFPQINQSTFEAFPMAFDGGPDAEVVDAVDELLELTAERIEFDPNVADFLGRYEIGQSLGEISGCRTAEGVGETMLVATAEERPDLKLGSVVVERGHNSLLLSASARYKPDHAVETDRWGYAETELVPALEFVGTSDELQLLVETFVPYAVSEADGFANFRAGATKTTSPLDRLRALMLPRLGDVDQGLRKFDARRSRAAELDRKIANVERTIHERVYDLYGIPADQREVVDREFGDD